MKKKIISWLTTGLLLFCFALNSNAQPPRGPFVISPQILPDKKVVFRYLAPSASNVRLNAQFEKAPVPMVKDSIGIWSVTVGPVIPDIYPYSFSVDGVTVMDPANPDYFPNERFKASLVDVPGFTPLLHSIRNVPHGVVSYEYYPASDGLTGTVMIYTPPGYDRDQAKKYPVFYLISGTTDTEETFFKVGRVNMILDNLIAEGKVKPMIIVMPYGNIAARTAEQKNQPKPADPTGRDNPEAVARSKAFEDDLTKKLIPWVDKNYRTVANRDSRAIGGFSRGGGQTLRAAFGNLDQFAWVCAYSSYLSDEEMKRSYSHIIDNVAETNSKLKLLWIGVGTEDFLYSGTAGFLNFLTANRVVYTSRISGGGHTWMNVRNYVAETAQLLFK
ncbi:alpha/beta hydrolase-fold protein [Pollutibacter soli]|uniref:alpha/beta hydrolase-fold protein n=1 Tax=Pollutibacter soli TaxID=3034157 RepID=UPI003013DA1A